MSEVKDEQDANCKLFIGNINYQTREADLEELFGKYGKIKDCRVAMDNQTNRSRGFAFITMEEASSAEEALNAISGTDVDGRIIKVEFSTGRSSGGNRDNRSGNRDNRGGGNDYNRGYDRHQSRGNYDRGSRYNDRDRSRSRDRNYDRRRRSRSPEYRRRSRSPDTRRRRSRSPEERHRRDDRRDDRKDDHDRSRSKDKKGDREHRDRSRDKY